MSEEIKFFVCGDVEPPKRNAKLDAGIDVFVPNLNEQFMIDLTAKNNGHPFRWGVIGTPPEETEDGKVDMNSGMYLYIAPGEDLLIPTYLKARIPNNMYLKVANKSGVCTKQKLVVGADTIDSSYEGIMHIHVFNASNSMRFIRFGQSIAQLIPTLIDNNEIEVWYDENIDLFKEMKNQTNIEKFFEGHETKRKDKGFGEGNEHDKANPKPTEKIAESPNS